MASGPVPVGTVTCVDPTTIAASVALAGSCCLVSLASCWLALAHIERLTPSLGGPLCHWFGASLHNRLKDQEVPLRMGAFWSACHQADVAHPAVSSWIPKLLPVHLLPMAIPWATDSHWHCRWLSLDPSPFVFKLVGPRPDRRHLSHIGDTNTDSRRLGYASVQSTDKKMRTTKLGNPPKVTTIEYAIIQHCTA